VGASGFERRGATSGLRESAPHRTVLRTFIEVLAVLGTRSMSVSKRRRNLERQQRHQTSCQTMEREDNTIGPLRLPALLPAETATRKTICVTGATGFAGAHIVLRSLLAGHTVRGTVRPVPDPCPFARANARRRSPRCVPPQPPLVSERAGGRQQQATGGRGPGTLPIYLIAWYRQCCRALMPCAALRTLHVVGWPTVNHTLGIRIRMLAWASGTGFRILPRCVHVPHAVSREAASLSAY
jgi:hypothetical protein